MSKQIGFVAENYAKDYLQKHGLKLIESNYYCRVGEIDLIMRDGDFIVFVEVRSRASNTHGNALESITYFKQQKLIKAANYYLLIKKHQNLAARFDVFTLDGIPPKINWIKNAFGM